MYEEINEMISVVALFENGRAVPRSFTWRGRKYLVETINLEHQERHGDDIIFCFSVVANGNIYELSFNSQHLVWRLEKTWTE